MKSEFKYKRNFFYKEGSVKFEVNSVQQKLTMSGYRIEKEIFSLKTHLKFYRERKQRSIIVIKVVYIAENYLNFEKKPSGHILQ